MRDATLRRRYVLALAVRLGVTVVAAFATVIYGLWPDLTALAAGKVPGPIDLGGFVARIAPMFIVTTALITISWWVVLHRLVGKNVIAGWRALAGDQTSLPASNDDDPWVIPADPR